MEHEFHTRLFHKTSRNLSRTSPMLVFGFRTVLVAVFLAMDASPEPTWQGVLSAASASEDQALLESGLQERRTALQNLRLVVEESESGALGMEQQTYVQATYELRHLNGSYYIKIHNQTFDSKSATLQPLFDSESNYLKDEGIARMYANQLQADVQGGRVARKQDGVIRNFIYGLHVNDFGVDMVEPFLPTAARLLNPQLALPNKWDTERLDIKASELSLASDDGEQQFETVVLDTVLLMGGAKSKPPNRATYSLAFVPDLMWLPALMTKRYETGDGVEWSEQEYRTVSFRKVNGVALPLTMTTTRSNSRSAGKGVIESRLLEASLGQVTQADLAVTFPAGVEVIDEISGRTGVADASGAYEAKPQQPPAATARRNSTRWMFIVFNIAALVLIASIWLYSRHRGKARG